jgi:hypothetical protein
LHVVAAQLFPEPARPIIMLGEPEADQLSEAIMNVAQHYDLGGMFNSKYFALGNLVVTAGMIYVPRAMALGQLSKQMQAQARHANGGLPGMAPDAPLPN